MVGEGSCCFVSKRGGLEVRRDAEAAIAGWKGEDDAVLRNGGHWERGGADAVKCCRKEVVESGPEVCEVVGFKGSEKLSELVLDGASDNEEGVMFAEETKGWEAGFDFSDLDGEEGSSGIEKTASSKQEDEVVDVANEEGEDALTERRQTIS